MARNHLIKVRRDTAANWTSVNPVLAAGEPGLETDTAFIKYGDGSTAWNSLAYLNANASAATFNTAGKTRQLFFNAKDYGAKGDLKYVFDGALTSGSPTVTCATTTPFVPSDVGKKIIANGISATIVTYNSASSIDMSVNSGSTVSGKEVKFATDDTSAIQSALAAAGAVGGTLLFPPGMYITSLPLKWDSTVTPATAATGTLTSNNTNVSNNDTVTLGGNTYTFKTTLTEVFASGTLTSNNTNVSNNDTVTIGFKTYTFKTSLTGATYEVKIGVDADTSLANLASAINGTTGGGSTYGSGTVANVAVSSTASPTSHVLTFTSYVVGTVGNRYSFSTPATTLTASGTTLSGGVDSVARQVLIGSNADDSLTNLASAINGTTGAGTKYSSLTDPSGGAISTATPTSHVLTFTAQAPGASGNTSVALAKSAATLTVSGTFLAGGIDAVGDNSLAPSIVGNIAGKGGVSNFQSFTSAHKIVAWDNFPPGEFLIDHIAAPLTDTNNDAFVVRGLMLDCNSIAAGIRSFNSNNSIWEDIMMMFPAAPNPANNIGFPQGAFNAIALPTVSSYQNTYRNIQLQNAGKDGFYIREGEGSFVRVHGCTSNRSTRYGFNTDDACTLIDCTTQLSGVGEYYVNGSILVACRQDHTRSGANAVILAPNGGNAQFIGCDFYGCQSGTASGEQNLSIVNILHNAGPNTFVGCNFRAATGTSDYIFCATPNPSVQTFGNCNFTVASGGQAGGAGTINGQNYNDAVSNSSFHPLNITNGNGINPDSWNTQSVTGTFTVTRSLGRVIRLSLSADTTFTFSAGIPGDSITLDIVANGHTPTWPGNVTFIGGSAPSVSSRIVLSFAWQPDAQTWQEIGRSAGFTNPMTTLGDIIYEDSTPTAVRLAGNTTSTKKFLRQTGTGSISAVPAWDTLVAGDIPDISATYLTPSNTATVTNKRNTKRSTTTAAPGATPSINTDNVDYVEYTGMNAAITSLTGGLSGTPARGDTLWMSFTDDGTARGITFGSSFESSGNVTLPATTVISTRLDVLFAWNVATSKWRCVSVA